MQVHERMEGKGGKKEETGKGTKGLKSVEQWEELQEGETAFPSKKR